MYKKMEKEKKNVNVIIYNLYDLVYRQVFYIWTESILGILKLLCTVVFFPVILIGMVVGGLVYIAFPLLLIGGIIGLIVSKS